ncbi:MAG: hypothetical protein HND55_12210 [Pseudomonadota bacterium]|nr:MAG: hypothetical protein HND55_12210 [Pseudomonadota bacterium]
MKPIFHYLALLALLTASAPGPADETPRPLAKVAAESDWIVLAQLNVFDYEQRRGIPVSGETWFDVLLPYKVPQPAERLKVTEEGFGEGTCYFDEAKLWNELPRYLLFLVEDEGELRGHPDGCSLPVLITADNRYAVRWPIRQFDLGNEAEALVREFDFQGPGAFVDLDDMTSIQRERRIESDFLAPVDDGRYRYTRGIEMEDFRSLIAEHLTRDRLQRGR